MKRIMIIYNDGFKRNGATKSLMAITKFLIDKDIYDIDVIIPSYADEIFSYIKSLSKNVHIYRYNYTNQVYSDNGILSHIKGLLKFGLSYLNTKKFYKRELKNNYYDIVYSNTGVIYIGAWISKWMNTIHVWHIREFGKEDQNTRRVGGFYYFNKLINNKTHIIFISKSLQEYYDNKISIPYNKHLIYNNLPSDIVSPLNISKCENKNIIVVGTIRKEKGQFLAIQAFEVLQKKHTDYKLFIVGSNNKYCDFLKKYVEEKNIKNVFFTGYIDDLTELWKKSNIAIVASNKEAFGRIIIEYYVNSISIIASDTGSFPELIENYNTGLLFKNNNLNDLVEKLEIVINNKTLCDEMILNGYNFGLEFCKNKNCVQLIELFDSLY